MEGEGAAYYTY